MNRHMALPKFSKISSQGKYRFSEALFEAWPLYVRQFYRAFEDYNVPLVGRGNFLLLRLREASLQFFMETLDALLRGNRDWYGVSGAFCARYASLTPQEEASTMLDNLLME